jgi:DNA primase catalytic core
MSSITEWIKNELYPSLYEVIDRALPEFNFKRKGIGWVSSNKLKVTGEEGESIGKVYVYANNVGYIKDYTRDSLSLITYIMQRDNIGFIDAVKRLADIVGLELPKGDFNEGAYKSYREKADILEDCNSYFTYCLENSPEAEEVKTYLASRGYSDEDIKAMELGYIPAQDKLFKHLQSKGHSQTLIEEVVTIKHDTRIGSTHKLTIPYRSGNSIKGFKFRNINHKKGDKTDKYLNSKGMDKSGGFFNLLGIKGDKDIVIVEGELDSLSATARGVENVVATGGSSISSEQIKDAIRKGAKSFTLCFDTEVGKEDKTSKDINTAISVILAEGVNRVYIVNLPDINGGKTDPDSLIKEKGVEAFKQAITEAVTYWEYKLQNTLIKYSKIQEERELQARDIDSFLDEVVETSYQIVDPIDKDRYKTAFISLESIKGLGISGESWDITLDRLTATRDKENQTKELRRLLSDATNLQSKGETDKALELLDTKLKEVKLKDKTTEFSSLLLPTSEALVKEAEENKPKDLETGYTINGEDFSLPAGAITVYAGATGHGKTILSINTALNVAERYPEKKFIFFTYEERDTAIIQYFLNTYIDRELNDSDSPKSNRRVIKDYFKTGSTQYISKKNLDYFQSKKEEFFTTYIETGRILVKYVDFTSQELDLAIRYLHKNEPNIGGVFVDYFQLLNLPASLKKAERINSRQEELKEICQSLKRVAIDTGLPLVLGAQFNRDVTDLSKLHPTKIGEAGDIERIVNTLVGLWDISKNTVGKDTSTGEANQIKVRTKEATSGMYIELMKSRELQTGIYELLDYNGKTGKIKNKEYSKPKTEEEITFYK